MPDNVTSMAFNKRQGVPWHGKGAAVDGLMTAAECIRKAGLDWGVAKIPVRIDDVAGLPIPDHAVTVRTDLLATDKHWRFRLSTDPQSRTLQQRFDLVASDPIKITRN